MADELPVHRLNLNLLYPLDAILHAPTLTEAGRRVRLSQSAMSHALRRLREHFDDDLVTYLNGEKQLTPLGLALRDEARRVMREVNGTFNFSLVFDPLTSPGTITVAAPDAIEQILLGTVQRLLVDAAPRLTVNVIPLDAVDPRRALDQGADLLVLPVDAALPELEQVPIVADYMSCMVWTGHSRLKDRYDIDEETYRSARHVTARDERLSMFAGDPHASDLLRSRHIVMRTSSQAAFPTIVIGSDLIATGSVWLFQHYASILPVKVVSAPFDRPAATIVVQCAAHRRRDPMIGWFVRQIEDYARLTK
ncbi:LysR family transcriptional regulator [Sphingomonas sp. GM_Shp_1]|uniref:LysR family transcriptional regulator n=1 Tax=Sphingomonas sp. GM_Shp_1 TaxID=2937381 RepID=UPI00226B14BC|nr:LysR family transcriptional regulator [Sphingomonas sp. GM_Shp_1]